MRLKNTRGTLNANTVLAAAAGGIRWMRHSGAILTDLNGTDHDYYVGDGRDKLDDQAIDPSGAWPII